MRYSFLLIVLALTPALGHDISIASFNIRIFSTGSRDDAELELIADRLQQFDFWAHRYELELGMCTNCAYIRAWDSNGMQPRPA